MYHNKKIGVVVPAYNEEKFIGSVIDTMPGFVDKIYISNDASTDKTAEIAAARMKEDPRVVLINRPVCGGVGAAILSGHRRALLEEMDVVAVMAGDGQMDPDILDRIITPVVEGRADYCKGNRLSSTEDQREMPPWRTFGNVLLTGLSRIASGYWHITDPQDGYTAISTAILKKMDIDKIEGGFAFENSMLVRLNVAGAKVVDVPHPAVYRGQQSKIRYGKFIINTSWILLKDFVWRIWMKYIRRKSSAERD